MVSLNREKTSKFKEIVDQNKKTGLPIYSIQVTRFKANLNSKAATAYWKIVTFTFMAVQLVFS